MSTNGSAIAEFHYDLPADRIARHPIEKREEARLFVVDRTSGEQTHSQVKDLGEYLREGDLLVVNRARVDPARVVWRKPTGGQAELLLLNPHSEEEGDSQWEALVGGKNLRIGKTYSLPGNQAFRIEARGELGLATVRMRGSIEEIREWLPRVGQPPLPPYIRKERARHGEDDSSPEDAERYQTVFADQSGAVAAPTAGLHFSAPLLATLQKRNIEIASIHLAVGWGTFQPVTEEHVASGKLHQEWVEVSEKAGQALRRAKDEGRRVIAVGTTVVRTLEWWHDRGAPVGGAKGWCDLFLRPPWTPNVIDALLTNFHLPKSSLLALVAGFLGEGGTEKLLALYREAIERKYRFYSYGDAMLIM